MFDLLINCGVTFDTAIWLRMAPPSRNSANRPVLKYQGAGRGCRMTYGDRKSERVNFDHGIPVYIMGIDGTWRRECTMIDVSQTGARLHIEGSLEGLDLKEFFLLLSSTGLAYRRCQLVRVAGDQIGIEFLAREKKPRRK